MSRLSNIPSLHTAISAACRRSMEPPAPPNVTEEGPARQAALLPAPSSLHSGLGEKRPRSARRQLWLAAAAMVAGAVAALSPFPAHNQPYSGGAVLTRPAAQESTTPLDLAANREAAGWRVSWNPAIVAGLAPGDAVLLVREGGNEVRVPFTPKELSLGTLFYRPTSGDVFFSLKVNTAAGRLVEESVHALGEMDLPAPPRDQFVETPANSMAVPAPSSQSPAPAAAAPVPAGKAAPAVFDLEPPAVDPPSLKLPAVLSAIPAPPAPGPGSESLFDPAQAGALDPRAIGSPKPAGPVATPSFVPAKAVVRVTPVAPRRLRLRSSKASNV